MVYFLIGSSLIQKNTEETWRRVQGEGGIAQVPGSGANGSGKPITVHDLMSIFLNITSSRKRVSIWEI